MKKGFTLAELMGVIVIMAAIALIIIPVVDKQIKDGKNEIYHDAIDSIKSSMNLFMSDKKIQSNESMTVTLYQLKQAGLIDLDVKNPKNGELFPNDMLIIATNENGVINYTVDVEGSNKINYQSVPKMSLNVPVYEVIEIGDSFSAKTSDISSYGDVVIEPIITNNVDITKIGSYQVIYEINYNNLKNKIIKTVIVRDMTGPTIDFETLNISLSKAKKFDFLSDITVSDNGCSSDEIDVKVENPKFGALTGTYSVKYIATDKYGNETVKYRKVITS